MDNQLAKDLEIMFENYVEGFVNRPGNPGD